MDDHEFIARTSQRLEQRSQGMRFPADSVFSIRDASLQRLSDHVAADPVSYDILYRPYPFVLSSGEISIAGQTPTLLLSKDARKHWLITMTSVRFPIKPLPSYTDLLNPPPTPDYYFYATRASVLMIRDSNGDIPAETAVQFYANYTPLITDPVFSSNGELSDDLIDIAVAICLESSVEPEVVRHAEGVKATGQMQ